MRWLLYLHPQFPNISNSDKLEFIRDYVYPETRTWDNWLTYEYRYRPILDEFMPLYNGKWDWERSTGRELYLTVNNWDIPLQHYWHINLGLNSETPRSFKEKMQAWDQEYQTLANRIDHLSNKKIVEADSLFDSELNQDFYNLVVDFFGFQRNHSQAQYVHQLYYQCRERAARDFVNYVESAEWQTYVKTMKDKFATTK